MTGRTEAPARLVSGVVRRWAVFACCLLGWQALTAYFDDAYFPTPVEIAAKMHELWFSGPANHLFLTTVAIENVVPSLGRLLTGWLIGSAIGGSLGLALGRSRTGLDYADAIINFGRALPAPALLPVFLVLFKIGTPVQLATIVSGVVWPVLLNTVQGAQSVEPVMVDTARAFGIGRARLLFTVVLPASLPKIFSGMRIALGLSLVLMVISELVGATNGIGYRFLLASQSFDLAAVWAWIALVGILGNVVNWLFLVLENRVLGRHRTLVAGAG
ncbi:ABC-type nitrate/sulfonate/bicarbonate transport system, permease component [Amycolatopsis pretoriensis]|uniref:ABC-type nitrate/sulfonate/bicarbonate transport system, permease component n=1 Tax=Amycolatopsis pretoriensis TaxID=218821 RepID=A0A1H5QQH0_9PSEU|nr:ABC transporter permease [Amycolatopsis pretoriensis]SEF27447.1 ABC-type nitrate/sulfonate/bicarbonate transport system, permease component [Amycolatopsis pretoriensis]